jgi:hypothetical protein
MAFLFKGGNLQPTPYLCAEGLDNRNLFIGQNLRLEMGRDIGLRTV